MSSGMSSDAIIKQQIIDEVGNVGKIKLRIFRDSSNEDQVLFEKGGLTFSYKGVDYGSCDAAWYILDESGKEIPILALEGTDALQRGSSGDAQYQRFHHALGAVKNGIIGVYYLRPGKSTLQLDLYQMAYSASKHEKGHYLIVQDLSKVKELLTLIDRFGLDSIEVHDFVDSYEQSMHNIWYNKKFSQYKHNWQVFAKRRSTIIYDDHVIKYAGRMLRNFTDSSQRAGHIAVGEMYLTKCFFYGKKVYYLCPRMSKKDVEYLDNHKKSDKEWYLLRHENNVLIKTRDDLEGLSDDIKKMLISVSDKPLKGEDLKTYNKCVKSIVKGIIFNKIKVL